MESVNDLGIPFGWLLVRMVATELYHPSPIKSDATFSSSSGDRRIDRHRPVRGVRSKLASNTTPTRNTGTKRRPDICRLMSGIFEER